MVKSKTNLADLTLPLNVRVVTVCPFCSDRNRHGRCGVANTSVVRLLAVGGLNAQSWREKISSQGVASAK